MTKWRIERAGAEGGGYLPGWIAINGTGEGAYFATHAEAIEFVSRQSAIDAHALTMALTKLAPRIPSFGRASVAPKRKRLGRPPKYTPEQIERAERMRRAGMTWAQVATAVGAPSPDAIRIRLLNGRKSG